MNPLLSALVVLASLLVAPAAAQEPGKIGNHPRFEPDRMARLALDYLEGHGVQQSDTLALEWWIIAQTIGCPIIEHITPQTTFYCGDALAAAEVQLSVLEDRMTPDQIAQAENMAREWLEAHPQ